MNSGLQLHLARLVIIYLAHSLHISLPSPIRQANDEAESLWIMILKIVAHPKILHS